MASFINTTDRALGGSMTVPLCGFCRDCASGDFTVGRLLAALAGGMSSGRLRATVQAFRLVVEQEVAGLGEFYNSRPCHVCGLLGVHLDYMVRSAGNLETATAALDGVAGLLAAISHPVLTCDPWEVEKITAYARCLTACGLGGGVYSVPLPSSVAPISTASPNIAEKVAGVTASTPSGETVAGTAVVFFDQFGEVAAVDLLEGEQEETARAYGSAQLAAHPAVYGVKAEVAMCFYAYPEVVEQVTRTHA